MATDKPDKKSKSKPKSEPKNTHIPAKRAPMADTTYFAKPGEVSSKWRLIDATGHTLGRLSTYIAAALMGKDKPTYTRSADTGDFVVVINAEKVALTGSKWSSKVYHHHTGFPGGVKSFSAAYLREYHPERLLEKAVWRMLPKGHMGRRWFGKLKVYAGAEHPHKAQKPETVQVAN